MQYGARDITTKTGQRESGAYWVRLELRRYGGVTGEGEGATWAEAKEKAQAALDEAVEKRARESGLRAV